MGTNEFALLAWSDEGGRDQEDSGRSPRERLKVRQEKQMVTTTKCRCQGGKKHRGGIGFCRLRIN